MQSTYIYITIQKQKRSKGKVKEESNMHSSKPYTSFKRSIVSLLLASSVSKISAVRPAISSRILYTRNRLQKSIPSISIIEQLRGGGGTKEVDTVKSKKRKGKSSKKSSTSSAKEGSDDKDNNIIKDTKQQIPTIEEASINTSNKPHNTNKLSYTEHTFDIALLSLGLSLGTSGTDIDNTHEAVYNQDGTKNLDTLAYYQYSFRNSVDRRRRRQQQQNDDNKEEYIQPSLSVVLGNYFLKTNGGTHIISCLLSILTSVLGMACLVLPSFPTSTNLGKNINAKILSRKVLLATTKYQLMQQTLLVAMARYMTGMVGAILLSASSIPQLGVRNVRRYLELTASEPIGQYLFYTALLVVWMGMFGGGSSGGKMNEYVSTLKKSVISIMNESAASAATTTDDSTTVAQLLDTLSQQPPPWFLSNGGAVTSLLILGPILLREIISIIWVFSDVLTLAIKSSDGMTGKLFSGMLTTCRATLDALMSILLSSGKWRKADSFKRQRTLSKLVSRISLVMELIVGILLLGDAIQVVWTFAFGNVSTTGVVAGRVPFKTVCGKIVCAHLYLNFIKSRRKKIARTVTGSVRGGGIHTNE